ncbi:MAG: hypothetical protein P4M07_09560 [Xanthobacteraceae bacterium]|nr:hypothetical protein [Xanthobacteraceae bacterium]
MPIALPSSPRRSHHGSPTADVFHRAALWAALALIAGVVFGTLSVHPF